MDALITPEHATQLIRDWEMDAGHGPACNFFRRGRFDVVAGEHLCKSCGVPKLTHRAYRIVAEVVHG